MAKRPEDEKEVNNAKQKSRPEPEYILYKNLGSELDFNYGDPAEVLGLDPNDWYVDQRIYKFEPESVIGTIFTFTYRPMPVTASTLRRAIRLIEKREGIDATLGGKVVYLLYSESPQSIMSWIHVSIHEVEPQWPIGVEPLEGSIHRVLEDPRARTLAVDMEAKWREQGGDPTRKFKKDGGWKFPKY